MVRLLALLAAASLAACSWALPPIPCTGDDQCPENQACQAGTCSPRANCGGGRLACGDRCVDASMDKDNCGRCGNVCGPTLSCQGGECVGSGQPVLTVSVTGTGTGLVTSSPSGLHCPDGACTAGFASGTVVTLTQTASNGSTFTGWSGACGGVGACTLTLNASASVTANFQAAQNRVLTVTVNGPGSVTSSPPGLNCSGTCSAFFAPGTSVTLTPTPGTSASFNGWGGDCGGAGGCTVSMTSDRSVSAMFSSTGGVDVSVTVSGNGTITSSPPGLSCTGGTCSATFTPGSNVTLTATPGSGATWQGWGGACAAASGTTCTLNAIQQAKTVTASFSSASGISLSISLSGPGTVTSSPPGLNCDSMGIGCSATFPSGTSVVLTAVAGANALFAGFSGGGCGSGTTCTLALTSPTNVVAAFQSTFLLSVSATGSGTGTITSDVGGLSCGSGGTGTCSARFASGSVVTLSATAGLHSAFSGWTGCMGASGASCPVTVWGDTSLSAGFTVGYDLTVAVQGSGTGAVHTSIAGGTEQLCSSGSCTYSVPSGSNVYLWVQIDTGSTLASLTGPGCSGSSCSFTMDAAHTVTAAIQTLRTLTVSASSGGTVSSDPAGIYCYFGSAPNCVHEFPDGAVVTLAPAVSGTPPWAYFVGWSGDCTGRGACVLTMDRARSVHADFLVFTLTSDGDYQHPLSLLPGETRSMNLTATLSENTAPGPIAFTVSGLPTGVTAVFAPAG